MSGVAGVGCGFPPNAEFTNTSSGERVGASVVEFGEIPLSATFSMSGVAVVVGGGFPPNAEFTNTSSGNKVGAIVVEFGAIPLSATVSVSGVAVGGVMVTVGVLVVFSATSAVPGAGVEMGAVALSEFPQTCRSWIYRSTLSAAAAKLCSGMMYLPIAGAEATLS
jgi:hypothetical protein